MSLLWRSAWHFEQGLAILDSLDRSSILERFMASWAMLISCMISSQVLPSKVMVIILSPLAKVRECAGEDDRLRFHQAGCLARLDELDFLSFQVSPKVLDRDFFGQTDELPGFSDAPLHRGRFWRGSQLRIFMIFF